MTTYLAKTILLALLCISAGYFCFSANEQCAINKSSHWHITTGKLLYNSDEVCEGTADKMLFGPMAWLSFIASSQRAVYSYEINGQKYTQERHSCVPTLTPVRIFINKEAFESKYVLPTHVSRQSMAEFDARLARAQNGEVGALFEQSEGDFEDHRPSVCVRYNPKNPGQSEIDPQVLKLPESIKYTGAAMLIISILGLLAISFHESIVSPVNDPMLNIDTAREYYRQRQQGRRPVAVRVR
jgi:hypothetical protein